MSIFDELLIAIEDQPDITRENLFQLFPAVAQQQLSSTIGRLIGRGWLESVEMKSDQRLRVSQSGNRYISTNLEIIHANEVTWDGEWFWVVASLPETKRRERDLLRLGLTQHGFGRLIDGLYLHPRDQQGIVTDLIQRFGLGSHLYLFKNSHLGRGTHQIVMSQAWDWALLANRLDTFFAQAEPRLAEISKKSRQLVINADRLATQKVRLAAKNLVFEYGKILVADPNFPIDLVANKEPYRTGQKFYQMIRRYCYLS